MAGNSKNFLPVIQIITAGDMSADITGPATNISYLDNVAIQLNFTGTPTGTFSIQGSLDHKEYNGQIVNAGNFVPLTFSSTLAASGAAGQILLDLNQLSFPYIRIVYTRTSGSGSLDAYISAKAV